jgi:hypothetical protein
MPKARVVLYRESPNGEPKMAAGIVDGVDGVDGVLVNGIRIKVSEGGWAE